MGKGLSLHMGEAAFYEYKLELSYPRISSDTTYYKSALNPFFLNAQKHTCVWKSSGTFIS